MNATCFFLLLSYLCAATYLAESSETSRNEYLALAKEYPRLVHPLGNASKGEIEVLLDPEKMAEIERKMGRDVGVLKKDAYFIWVNDACLFPNGKEGVYGRILWVGSLSRTPAIAIMSILPNGEIVLNCNFRHATRSWEIELPRGLVDKNETPEEAAFREAKEETGMLVESLWKLGDITPDNGMESTLVSVFAATISGKQEQSCEDSEAIEKILSLSIDEIRKAFKQGYYSIVIRGEEKQVAFRDPFLAYALTIYNEDNL